MPNPSMALKPATCLLCCVLALACATPSPSAHAAAPGEPGEAGRRYDLGAGALDDALGGFIDQSKAQLLYAPALVRGKRSTGLKGVYRTQEALARLLDGHSLTAVRVTPNTYLLQPAPIGPPREHRNAVRARAEAAQGRPGPSVPTQLAAVTVVGSRIPRTAFDTSVPVSVITAEDIQSSGVGTLYELLREQPGMLGHHPVAVASEGLSSLQPIVTAASASLYSLGPRGTLFLVDGRRVASFGFVPYDLGGLFDLNSIPLSFIDRIEILRGLASATYGADAAAGAVNIVLKKDMQGGEAAARHGVSDRGDAQLSGLSANFGARTGAGGTVSIAVDLMQRQALEGHARAWSTGDSRRLGLFDLRVPLGFQPADVRRRPLPFRQCDDAGNDPDSPYCKYDIAQYRTLQPRLRARSAYAHWRQPLGDSVSLEFSARHSWVRQTVKQPPRLDLLPLSGPDAPQIDFPDDFPPGYADANARYAFYDLGSPQNQSLSRTLDLSAGAYGTWDRWNWRLALSHSQQRTQSAVSNLLRASAMRPGGLSRYRLFGDNSPALLDSLKASIHPRGRDAQDSLEASLDGPWFQAPGGPAEFSVGLALRKERLVHTPDPLQSEFALATGATDVAARDIRGHSVAAFAEARIPVHRTLQFDLAAHLEREHRFSPQPSSRIGLAWAPHERVRLRASFGQTRRPPSLQDRRNPYGGAPQLWGMYVRPLLQPCREVSGACMVELGAGENPDLRPESARSASIGLTMAPTDAFDLRIERYWIERWNEFGISNTLNYPELHPPGLVRNAEGELYRIAEHVSNIGSARSRGWDASANYLLRTGRWGSFYFQLSGHYLQSHTTATIYDPGRIEDAGYTAPKLSMAGSVKWRYGDLTTSLAIRRFGRSRAYSSFEGSTCWWESLAPDKCTNPSATLLSLNVNYTGFDRWILSLGVNNLADRQPVNYHPSLDGYNIAVDDPYGRYYVLTTTYRF